MSDHEDRVARGVEIIKKEIRRRENLSRVGSFPGGRKMCLIEEADALDAVLRELSAT